MEGQRRNRLVRTLHRGLLSGLAAALVLGTPPVAAMAEPTHECAGQRATVVGTDGDDVLSGTPGPDVIVGGNGDDVIDGLEGNDTICGGNGKDVLTGGLGDDFLLGQNGVDRLQGGAGADSLEGGNGPDHLDAGAGADAADGGNGVDECIESETTIACEDSGSPESTNPLRNLGPAPPGTVPVNGPDGVHLVINSGGGIHPWDVTIARDRFLTQFVADSMVSPAYQVSLPEAGVVNSATLRLPYEEALLGRFPEEDLRVYHFDDDLGLWTPAWKDQQLDLEANTITVEVDEFSAYGIFKLGPEGFSKYWDSTEVFCLQQGDAEEVGADVTFLMDTSGSMSSEDPTGMRVTGAKQFVDAMGPSDRAGVISFSGYASVRAPLTALSTEAGVTTVKQALDSTRYASGSTDISAAVDAGLDLYAEPQIGRARVMILMTDGVSPYDTWLNDAARDLGVVIYTIGLGSGVNGALLQQIADSTGGRYLHLSSPEQLPDIYEELAGGLIDDGTDGDGDGLTDCEETYGVLTSYSFYDVSLDPDGWRPMEGERRTTSDPSTPHTDADSDNAEGDRLTDGEELGERIDLRDYPELGEDYAFLIDAGVTSYYYARSDPNLLDSDQDGVDDGTETRGVRQDDGQVYTSWADRRDTDFDLLTDDVEYEIGTDPRIPDANELGIKRLKPYTLFQHERYGTYAPIVKGRFQLDSLYEPYVEYVDTVLFDDDFNCVDNCSAIIGATSDVEHSWCWVPFVGENCSTEEKVRTIVEDAVNVQGVFTQDGDFRGDFVAEQGVGECLATTAAADADGCVDPSVYDDVPEEVKWAENGEADGESLDQAMAAVVFAAVGGYNPKNLCSKTGGGVYKLVELAADGTEVIRYIGQTNDFERRFREHAKDPRLKHLDPVRVWESDNRQARRGLEQRLFNDVWGDVDVATAQANGSLNRQRPMSFLNKVLRPRLDLAERFLRECL